MPQSPPSPIAQSSNQLPSYLSAFQNVPPQQQQFDTSLWNSYGGPSLLAGTQLQENALVGSGANYGQGGQLGALSLQTQQQQQFAGQSALQQQQGLALSGASIGIQQQGIAQELGLAPQQQAVEQQQYALQQQQLQAQKPELASQATQEGAVSAKGKGGQYGATQGEQQAYKSLQTQIQQGVLGQKSEQLGYQYSLADLGRQQQQLSIAAAQNGLSETEVNTRLSQAIQSLHLQGVLSAQDIWQQFGQTAEQGSSQLTALALQIASTAGLNLGPTGTASKKTTTTTTGGGGEGAVIPSGYTGASGPQARF